MVNCKISALFFSATESGVIHNFCQFSALCRLTIFFIQSINFCRGERSNL